MTNIPVTITYGYTVQTREAMSRLEARVAYLRTREGRRGPQAVATPTNLLLELSTALGLADALRTLAEAHQNVGDVEHYDHLKREIGAQINALEILTGQHFAEPEPEPASVPSVPRRGPVKPSVLTRL